jgi:hypothetical protein
MIKTHSFSLREKDVMRSYKFSNSEDEGYVVFPWVRALNTTNQKKVK